MARKNKLDKSTRQGMTILVFVMVVALGMLIAAPMGVRSNVAFEVLASSLILMLGSAMGIFALWYAHRPVGKRR